MYLLDTNICIALLNGNHQAVTKFNRFFSQSYLSMIVSELYNGEGWQFYRLTTTGEVYETPLYSVGDTVALHL